ncbi:MAG: putative MATE family efflux protein [Saprospiraceae bacterium]|jgi:putative MATE family efflux protein
MPNTANAKYLHGSTMRHVIDTTLAGSLGLMAIFLIDLVDMYFISLLGEPQLAAAVGFASTIIFFTTSIGIGMGICLGALVSMALGKGEEKNAKQLGIDTFVSALILSIIVVLLVWTWIPELLTLLGAQGDSHGYSVDYLSIIIPSMPFIVMAMACSSGLRALGDAKRAMTITLLAGLTNAILDPILIFGLEMGIKGAAWASVIARVVAFSVGAYLLVKVHDFYVPLSWSRYKKNVGRIIKFAVPAILTNVATPIGNAYVISAIAAYGSGAVAGMAIVGRLTPVAFAMVFALSGAIGPIVGQNYGAQNFQRVREAIKDSMIFIIVTVFLMSVILFFAQGFVVWAFKAGPEAAELVQFFCTFIAIFFIANGMGFLANAAFNNLNFPKYSAWFNFGKTTLGTIPFVYVGAKLMGPKGVLLGQAIGGIIFSALAVIVLYRVLKRSEKGDANGEEKPAFTRRTPSWPHSNNRL